MTKKYTVESDDKCPKCGVKQWWHDNSYLARDQKHEIITSHCDNCNRHFKRIVKLILLSSSGKLKTETNHTFSNWQLFCRDGLAQGKTLKELSSLYWKEWQTNHKFPDSLSSLTSSTTTGKEE